jgi:hypothetical protein
LQEGVLDIAAGDVIGVVVETQCRYFSELAFPQTGGRRITGCACRQLERAV